MSDAVERLDVLDGLRGLAISLVVWYHAWLVSGFSVGVMNFIAEAGFLGVDLFFFISGFCLFYPYARAKLRGGAMPATRRFFMRRAAKIVPSYLLALTIFALVYRDRFASPQDAAVQIASHLSFFHTLDPATFGGISGPLWTIGIEAQFYFIFPLVCVAFCRSPWMTYIGMTAIGEGYRFGLTSSHLDSTFWAFNQLPAYFGIFGAGMLAAHLVVATRHRATPCDREWFTVLAFGGLVLAIAGLAQVTNIYRELGIDACYAWVNAHRIAFGPLCLVIAVSSALAVKPWRAFVGMRPLVFLSVISYNLYLWNLEIIFWLRNAGLSPELSFWLAIPSSLAVATAVTYVLERPILQASAPRPVAPAAAARPAAVPVRSQ